MKQVEHGVLAALVVASRRIDGHAALHLQCGTVVPYLRKVSVGYFIHTIQIALVALLVADDEDIGEADDVAVHIDIGRILHARHTVDVESVAVHLGGELIGGVAPHTVLALYKLGHAWGIILAIARNVDLLGGQEVACHLYLHSLGRKEIECHGSVLVDDG